MHKGKIILGAAALVSAVGGLMPAEATAGESVKCEGDQYHCKTELVCYEWNQDGSCKQANRIDYWSDTKGGGGGEE